MNMTPPSVRMMNAWKRRRAIRKAPRCKAGEHFWFPVQDGWGAYAACMYCVERHRVGFRFGLKSTADGYRRLLERGLGAECHLSPQWMAQNFGLPALDPKDEVIRKIKEISP